MNKKYIIRNNNEIERIINLSNKTISKCFIIYSNNNNLKYNRYCVSVSKKIGKSNVRNYYKRIIKDILSKNKFNSSNDYVIILRKLVLEKKYTELKDELIKILKGDK